MLSAMPHALPRAPSRWPAPWPLPWRSRPAQTFSPDGGLSVAAAVADQELRKDIVAVRSEEDASAAQARVRHLLARTLSAETAVQIALLNNRGLQAAYNELGIAEAVRVRQSLPPNPQISVVRVVGRRRGGTRTPDRRQHSSACDPAGAHGDRRRRFRQAQLTAALETCGWPTARARRSTAPSPPTSRPRCWCSGVGGRHTRRSSPSASATPAR